MTQLPFFPQPPLPQPSSHPDQTYADPHHSVAFPPVTSSDATRQHYAPPSVFQAGPSGSRFPSALPYEAPLAPYSSQSWICPSPSSLPYDVVQQASPASQAAVPPPRRPTTGPSVPQASEQSTVNQFTTVETPAVTHHKSLVAYYWHYAQQGYSAPLTATPHTEERLMQEKARTEAVDWARQCGIEVREVESRVGPSQEPPSRSAARPLPVAPSIAEPIQSVSSVSAGLSSASSGSSFKIDSGRALPSVPTGSIRSVSLANPEHSTLPMSAPLHRSFSEAQAQLKGNYPAQSQSDMLSDISHAQRKRPLPAPPIAASSALDSQQLTSRLANIVIADPVPSPCPVPPIPPPSIVPAISLNGKQSVPVVSPPSRSPSPCTVPSAAPAIPTFAFNDEPEENTTSAPAIPSFSFSLDDDEPAQNSSAHPRAPPIHPRYDPTHPSHALYHPTSIASSLQGSSSRPTTVAASIEAGTIECVACRQPIFGRVLMALSRNWHPNCFVCAQEGCGERLEVMEFEGTPDDWEDACEVKDGESGTEESLKGKAWCMVHFEERFALECYHCHTPISSADYLPINDPALPPLKSKSSSTLTSSSASSTRYYHPLHFFCAGCGDPFLDPVAYERSGEAIAKPYYVREQHPYCEKCDLRIWRDKCPGCKLGLREEDGYVEIGEEGEPGEKKKWHEGCFKCSMCSRPLTGIYLLRPEPVIPAMDASRDFVPESKPYCGECFDRAAMQEASTAVKQD